MPALKSGVHHPGFPLAAGAMLLLAGCSHQAAPPAPPPPKVSVVTVRAEAVPIITELPGRVTAHRTADVRPQVNGIILKRLFVEGSEVKAGQQLGAGPAKQPDQRVRRGACSLPETADAARRVDDHRRFVVPAGFDPADHLGAGRGLQPRRGFGDRHD